MKSVFLIKYSVFLNLVYYLFSHISRFVLKTSVYLLALNHGFLPVQLKYFQYMFVYALPIKVTLLPSGKDIL